MQYTTYASHNTIHDPRITILVALHLSRVLYKSTLFMQNKPNLPAFPRILKMNITSAIIMNYIYEPRTTNYELITQNKPNQTQYSSHTVPFHGPFSLIFDSPSRIGTHTQQDWIPYTKTYVTETLHKYICIYLYTLCSLWLTFWAVFLSTFVRKYVKMLKTLTFWMGGVELGFVRVCKSSVV